MAHLTVGELNDKCRVIPEFHAKPGYQQEEDFQVQQFLNAVEDELTAGNGTGNNPPTAATLGALVRLISHLISSSFCDQLC